MFDRRTIACLVIICLFAPTGFADEFDLSWHTIDGGGGFAAAGDFELEGTIGQSDPGIMSGGNFELAGGFWPGVATGAPCPGDLDGDNAVTLADLSIQLSNFGTPSGALPEDGDLDGNGTVDLADLALLLSAFGTVCP